MEGGIELSEVVEQLRSELLEAMDGAKHAKLRFGVESVEVELKVAMTKSGQAGAKAKFWVLELGAEATIGQERTQTVRLKLKPRTGAVGSPAREVEIKG